MISPDAISTAIIRGYMGCWTGCARSILMLYLKAAPAVGSAPDLNTIRHFDFHFISDTVHPREVLRIYQGALLRLPPGCLSKWAVIRSGDPLARPYNVPTFEGVERLYACADATWDRTMEVDLDYSMAIGFCGVLRAEHRSGTAVRRHKKGDSAVDFLLQRKAGLSTGSGVLSVDGSGGDGGYHEPCGVSAQGAGSRQGVC